MRNLLIFILVLIVIWWVRRALHRLQQGSPRGAARTRARDDADPAQPESMRACAHCGLHVPESEGVREGDAFFCCDEHRRLGVRRQDAP